MVDWLCLLRWGFLGFLLFITQIGEDRRPSHRFGGETMLKSCLSLEPGYIPVRIRRRVLQRDNYHCVWCGSSEKQRVSHFIQKRAGGETSFYNLVTTCESCKRKRHYDTPNEFISKLKLEKLDIFKEVKMRVRVTWSSGKTVEGELEDSLGPDTKAFWLKSSGNGKRRLIFIERGMEIEELGGGEKK